MTTRRAVAVLVSRFPKVTETFILREIVEMERQGQPVRLVPLLREKPSVAHPEAGAWMDRALFTPWFSAGILAANLRALGRDPARYLGVLGRVLWGASASANFFLRTLVLFPKSVYLAERLRAEGIGHLHAHFATHPATVALVVSALTGIGFSFTAHAHDIFVRRPMLRQKIREARFVRAISCFNRDFLAARYPEAAAKTAVIHVGVDPSAYESEGAGGGGPTTVLCVAALQAYKGLGVLVEACRQLHGEGIAFRCDIVGEGPLRAEIERHVARAGLGGIVQLRGARPEDEVARMMAAAAVIVLPSVVARDGQMEGIPVALMEAMAARRPVVASSLSGVPELVEDGVSGLLVEPGDAAGLASALRRLLADPGLRRAMGNAGRATVERRFRLPACVEELLARIDAHNPPVPAELGQALRASSWKGFSGSAVGVRRIHARPESLVAELLVSDGQQTREVVFKIQKARPGPPSERARREHDALSFLARRPGRDGHSGVPQPLHLDERGAAIVMERSRGVPLDDLIRAARGRRDPRLRAAVARAMRSTGRWLRSFQQRTGTTAAAGAALESLVAGARTDLEACVRGGLSPRTGARIGERLAAAAARARAAGPRLAGHHGDFWPGNIHVDVEHDVIEVIDFEGFRDGLPYEDACYFLAHLRLFLAYPMLGAERARLPAAFLDGYLEGAAFDEAGAEVCRTAKALQILARSGARYSGLRGWWRRKALRDLALGKEA